MSLPSRLSLEPNSPLRKGIEAVSLAIPLYLAIRSLTTSSKRRAIDGRADAAGEEPAVLSLPPAESRLAALESQRQRLARTSLTYLTWAFGPDGLNASDTLPGCMVASPSRPQDRPGGKNENENYYFQWSRDGGVCLRAIVAQWIRAEAGAQVGMAAGGLGAKGQPTIDAAKLERIIHDFFKMNIALQHLENRSGSYPKGIGEPKYETDGTPFEADWGRPQNDGPAIRAIAALAYANYVLATRPPGSDARSYILTTLFDPSKRAGLIRDDLEYVADEWKEPSFELWEEVQATSHFHTLMVQRRALLAGAAFAERPEINADKALIERFRSVAADIEQALEKHWNPTGQLHLEGGDDVDPNGPMFIRWDDRRRLNALPAKVLRMPHVVGTLGRIGGQPKPTQIDTAVLLGFLHAFDGRLGVPESGSESEGETWKPWSERAIVTLDRITQAFNAVYEINKDKRVESGVLCGRYPEDVYDGVVQSVAHPWFICTHAVSEILSLTLQHYSSLPSPPLRITPLTLPFFQRIVSFHDDAASSAGVGPSVSSGVKSVPPSAHASHYLPHLPRPLKATVYLRGSNEFERILRALQRTAEGYLDVARRYAARDGKMSEQIERKKGDMRGARELSWSYSSYLSAFEAAQGRTTVV